MKFYKLHNGIFIYENTENAICIIFKNFGNKLDKLYNIIGLSHFIEHYMLRVIEYPVETNGYTTHNHMCLEYYLNNNYNTKDIIYFLYNNIIKNNFFYFKEDENLFCSVGYDLSEEIYFNKAFGNPRLSLFSLIYLNALYSGGKKTNFKNCKLFFKILNNALKHTDYTNIVLSIPKITDDIISVLENTFGNLNSTKQLNIIDFELPIKKNKNHVLYYISSIRIPSLLFYLDNTIANIKNIIIFKYFYHNFLNIIKINKKLIIHIQFLNEEHLNKFLYIIYYLDDKLFKFIKCYDKNNSICNVYEYITDIITFSNDLNVYNYLIYINNDKFKLCNKFNLFMKDLKNIFLKKNFIISTFKPISLIYNTTDRFQRKYYLAEIDLNIKDLCVYASNLSINNKIYNTIKISLDSYNNICYFINKSYNNTYKIKNNIAYVNTYSDTDENNITDNFFKNNITCHVYCQLFLFYFLYNIKNIKLLFNLLQDEKSFVNSPNAKSFLKFRNYKIKITKEKKYIINTLYNFITCTFLAHSNLILESVVVKYVKDSDIGYSIIIKKKKINKQTMQIYFFLCCTNIYKAYNKLKYFLNSYNIENIIFILSIESTFNDFSNLNNSITITY
jgi:hypothetical protein